VRYVCFGSSTIDVAIFVTPLTSLKDIFSAIDSGLGISEANAGKDANIDAVMMARKRVFIAMILL